MKVQDNFIDKVVNYVSPVAGAKRSRARLLKNQIDSIAKRKYEGAATGRRTDGWISSSTSANLETLGSLTKLRDRSRDLVRNNSYASNAIDVIASNTIGTGIVAQIRDFSKSEKKIQTANTLWKAWAESQACDFDEKHEFGGLQNLCTRGKAEGGEMLIRRRIVKPTDQNPLPLQLQVLEPDFIDSSKNEDLNGGGRIIQGIEFNSIGKKVAYWLFTSHPGDGNSFPKSQRVQASEIIHDFRKLRSGQVRGVPYGASSFIKLRDFDEYEDAQLVRQKIAACFTAFIHDIAEPMGDDDEGDEFDLDKVEPGLIAKLGPGKDVKFGSPPSVQGYLEYVTPTLRSISVGFGVPYELLTGDFSNVNFSSGRMGWLQFHRLIQQWIWIDTVPTVCKRTYQWFTEAALLIGQDLSGTYSEWTPPRREMIDPVSETSSQRDAVRSGLITLSETIKQNGYDPEEHFKQIAEDNKKLDELKITLDSDPRKMSKVGFAQTPETIAGLTDGGIDLPKKDNQTEVKK